MSYQVSYPMSFVGIFEARDGLEPITRVEVPLIQRDYAQGRPEEIEIRSRILASLHGALTRSSDEGAGLVLDFVYGDVSEGVLRPIDGQQRLTTLFLLHWYLATRAGHLVADASWTSFTYATRHSAQLFCERLVANPSPLAVTDSAPAKWIKDQPWYLHVWRHDPTVQAMLVMLDAIHDRFGPESAEKLWLRLTEDNRVTFNLLPIRTPDRGEDLYIKMNSRGRPLTRFENFKAHFGELLERRFEDDLRVGHVKEAFDQSWTDLLWHYRGNDNLVDAQFMRYLTYVVEVCELLQPHGKPQPGRLEDRSDLIFSQADDQADDSASRDLDFFISAFEAWGANAATSDPIGPYLTSLFALSTDDVYNPDKVVIFGSKDQNLFKRCCNAAEFGLTERLLLFTVLADRIAPHADFGRRLRIVRNLAEATRLEEKDMPEQLGGIRDFVTAADLNGDLLRKFNSLALADEKRKLDFGDLELTTRQLEDHPILRGSLAAFDLDRARIIERTRDFEVLFADKALRPKLTGALLAQGPYQRQLADSDVLQFGTSSTDADGPWRELLTGAGYENLGATRSALARLLDEVDRSDEPPEACLDRIIEQALDTMRIGTELDWRYYFLAYPEMRGSWSGRYIPDSGSMGYLLSMLHRRTLNGYYRDPYLLAIWRRSDSKDMVNDPLFRWYGTERWLIVRSSDAKMRCAQDGFEFRPPSRPELADTFDGFCRDNGVVDDNGRLVARVRQSFETGLDLEDRVERGIALLNALAAPS